MCGGGRGEGVIEWVREKVLKMCIKGYALKGDVLRGVTSR